MRRSSFREFIRGDDTFENERTSWREEKKWIGK